MKHTAIAAALLSVSLLAGCRQTPTTPTPGTQTDFGLLKTLKPGVSDTINTRLKVNVVFVGYRQTPPGQVPTARQINTQDFRDTLPATYDAVNRIPSAYGRTEKTGTSFDFDYNYVFADQAFEDDFFKFAAAAGTNIELTRQENYFNCQGAPGCETPAGNITRAIDPENNIVIDALQTENWLADNGARVGVKNGEYTIYLINWYDRPDFKFHSYARLDAKDTDTEKKFGELPNRRLSAWGGSTRAGKDAQRVWFYDSVKELRGAYKTTKPGTYRLPAYLFNDGTDSQGGLLGIAYDDGETGTQSFVYSFLTPGLKKAGYGFTDTTVHEIGHHLSLSHPHDGYDSEQDVSYGPSGKFAFVNLGDQSASIMSYNDLSRTFGQFNLDSQYRYLTAAYLNNANAALESVRRAQKASAVSSAAKSADTLFTQAKTKYDALDYLGAATLAHQGYRAVIDAANTAGVKVEAYKWFENLNGLENLNLKPQAKARYSRTFLPQPGLVIFPEETAHQRKLRLMK